MISYLQPALAATPATPYVLWSSRVGALGGIQKPAAPPSSSAPTLWLWTPPSTLFDMLASHGMRTPRAIWPSLPWNGSKPDGLTPRRCESLGHAKVPAKTLLAAARRCWLLGGSRPPPREPHRSLQNRLCSDTQIARLRAWAPAL